MDERRDVQVLIVEDQPAHAALMRKQLEGSSLGCRTEVAETARQALALLRKKTFDLILLDYSLPDVDGLLVLDQVREIDRDVPVVFVTAEDSAAVAVQAMKRGASDYLVKHRDYAVTLPLAVGDALEREAMRRERTRLRTTLTRTRREVDLLRTELASRFRLENLVVESKPMKAVLERVLRAIEGDAPVLVTGETGVGKELVARAIHFNGPRRAAPFAALNCAAVPGELLESELFGYVRGAFTGATRDKAGILDKAQGGTLFLDEVGEMPRPLQTKLLRVIQEKTYRPVGATREKKLQVRFIAATNRELLEAIEAGGFRKDLYFRLNGIPVEVPPLRRRREDIAPLVSHFLRVLAEKEGLRPATIEASALKLLTRHPWPGNVRELEHIVGLAASSARDGVIRAHELRLLLRGSRSPEAEQERQGILAALERNRWNRDHAAAELGISRVSLWRKMRDLKIES